MKDEVFIPLESDEQKALVSWLKFHPVLKNFFCKNDNEGKRSIVLGYELKQMGLRPGVSDLFIYYPTKTYHGLWIEIKRRKKYSMSERRTPSWLAQEAFLESVKSVGFAGFMCYGWDDGREIIENYLLS